MRIAEIPRPYIDHICAASKFERRFTAAEIRHLDGRASRELIVKAVRGHMGIRPLDSRAWLEEQAARAAQTQHHYVDIINVLLEELVHHRYELPGFTVLERVAREAQGRVDEGHFSTITSGLTQAMRGRIDALFEIAPETTRTLWDKLKDEPGKPTNHVVRAYLTHIQEIQSLAEGFPTVDIPVAKLKHYRNLVRGQDASEMKGLKPDKRYALAVIYIRSCQSRALDDATDIFIRVYDRLEASAAAKLREYLLESAAKADELIQRFYNMLLAYDKGKNPAQRIRSISETLGNDVPTLLTMCEEHLTFADRNHLPFMLSAYPQSRSLLLNCLQITQPLSTTNDRTDERLIEFLLRIRNSRLDTISPGEHGIDPVRDLGWMSVQWRKLVFGETGSPTDAKPAHRKYLELSILQKIRNALRNGDLYVKRGEKFDDYREQLIDEVAFLAEAGPYGEVTGIDTNAHAFVSALRDLLTRRAREVDKGFKKNDHAWIKNGHLGLSRPKKLLRPSAAENLDLVIRNRLAPISIIDVLIDVERWLDLHKHFKSLAGTDTRIKEYRSRFITTLFCFGCNLGATQTSRSIKGINRKQLSWLNVKYVTEEALDKAITQVTNAYARYELPNFWGPGNSASADGTKYDLYERNMHAEYHIRYGGYGGIGYYHVSDKYIALFSRFISCGVYEGTYLLDGLMENESDIQPDTLHGDTHSQNYAVFAIAHMLGIRLMPRIRGISKLSFFRPSRSEKYKNIDDLFGPTIDWRLIETHFEEMLRVVVSIRMGRITASTMLRRFGITNRSRLAMAFRELGKVIRTLFLLDYVETEDLRRVINAATNKSEAFNNFIKWVFFGSEGIIQENLAHEQRKLVKYSHLVSSMISLHNVQAMTVVIQALRREGMEITPEMLSYLSPYRTWHINRFGDYVLDYARQSDPMKPDLRIFGPDGTPLTK